jgi:hypothetical protein
MGDHDPAGANQPASPSGGTLATAINGLIQVIMTLPVWFRAAVVLMIIIGGGTFVYLKYLRPVPPNPPPNPLTSISVGTDAQTYLSQKGTQDPDHPNPTDPQTLEASDKAAEADAAAQYHYVHISDENPEPIALGSQTDPNNSLHYRYYANTDRCLYIDRTEQGNHFTQWVLDPQFHFHDVHTANAQTATRSLAPAAPALLILPQIPQTPQPQPVQAGNCVNPHPGKFKFWWGPPKDKCNSPMYRQFADGCTHYQMYNRCANAWDGRINWTVCNKPPHH